jgi:hypothetical protein
VHEPELAEREVDAAAHAARPLEAEVAVDRGPRCVDGRAAAAAARVRAGQRRGAADVRVPHDHLPGDAGGAHVDPALDHGLAVRRVADEEQAAAEDHVGQVQRDTVGPADPRARHVERAVDVRADQPDLAVRLEPVDQPHRTRDP